MTPEQKAAYIFSQSVSLMAEIEGMKAANADREARGLAQAYGEEAFVEVRAASMISYGNAVIKFFED